MASGENRVSKPYPACPRLPNVSFIYNNIMNFDYNISDTVYTLYSSIIYMIVIWKADEIYIYILSYLRICIFFCCQKDCCPFMAFT